MGDASCDLILVGSYGSILKVDGYTVKAGDPVDIASHVFGSMTSRRMTVSVLAENQIDQTEYYFDFVRERDLEQLTDLDLEKSPSSISLGGIALSPIFNPAVLDYFVTLASHDVKSVPVAVDAPPESNVLINGNSLIEKTVAAEPGFTTVCQHFAPILLTHSLL